MDSTPPLPADGKKFPSDQREAPMNFFWTPKNWPKKNCVNDKTSQRQWGCGAGEWFLDAAQKYIHCENLKTVLFQFFKSRFPNFNQNFHLLKCFFKSKDNTSKKGQETRKTEPPWSGQQISWRDDNSNNNSLAECCRALGPHTSNCIAVQAS